MFDTGVVVQVKRLTTLRGRQLNDLPWRETLLRPEGIPDLDILPAGSVSRRAADLIGNGLQSLIDECSRHYDLVILDAPPLLGFPEPLQMATAVDGVVIVARAGQTSRKGVASVLNTLHRLRARPRRLQEPTLLHRLRRRPRRRALAQRRHPPGHLHGIRHQPRPGKLQPE